MPNIITISIITGVIAMGVFSFLGLKPTYAESVESNKSAYDFSFEKIEGGDMPLSEFKGKALLIVNTASECGFTGQYEGLQKLYEEFADKGLVVIAVPSNNFGKQEPGNNQEIAEFCETRFAVTFPLAAKVDVIGDNAHPFYKWAADELGFGTRPKWNFHKYLIDSNGNLVDHFNSTTSPEAKNLREALISALPAQPTR